MSKAEKYTGHDYLCENGLDYTAEIEDIQGAKIKVSKILDDFSNQKNKELRDKIKMIISDDVGHKSDEKLRWILIDKVINT